MFKKYINKRRKYNFTLKESMMEIDESHNGVMFKNKNQHQLSWH